MADKRITGEQNANAILSFLNRFGWLTTRMTAELVWPDKSQSLAMAKRTLKRLREKKLVLLRETPDGSECYTLSAQGARQLETELGVAAESGQTLSLGNALHRSAANWYLIKKIQQGFQVWTEYEIQTGRAAVCGYHGKVPDGLVVTDFGLVWVEVENSWKNREERQRIVRFCEQYLGNLDKMVELSPGHHLFRLSVVGTNVDALRSMARSFLEAYRSGFIREANLLEVEIALLPVSKGLFADKMREGFLWYDVMSPMIAADADPPINDQRQ